MSKRKAKPEAAGKPERKIELKPCPFCGGEALIRQDQYSRSYVVCPQCDTRSAARLDAARAAAAWNRRV
ncbi:MAG: Lar family restriction alleviation protein [Synergistaceae bacterium]|nr:Lar family restriction alleviation protein [Synergistaceae bacterium]